VDLDSRLKHGVGSEKVAGTTVTLVDMLASEVISIDVVPVPCLGQIVNIDICKFSTKEFASLIQSSLEFRGLFTKLLLLSFLVSMIVSMSVRVRLCASLGKIDFFAGSGEIGVSSPGQISFVDGLGEQDTVFFGHVAEVVC